jgi:hypothetical protein
MGRRRQTQTERHTQTTMLIIGFVVALAGISFAHQATGMVGAATADVTPLIQPYIDTYDSKMEDGMPDLVFVPLGDDVVVVVLTDLDRSYYGVIERGSLVLLEEGEVSSPTVIVRLTFDTLKALQYGDMTFDDAVHDGYISLSAKGFVRAIAVEKVLGSMDIYAIV